MAKKKEVDAVDAVPVMRGLLIHSDGSARPNPGFAGWGIHGYVYDDKLPTKGTGNSDYVLTADDYMSKTVKATLPNVPLVTPVKYIDGMGAVPPNAYNYDGTRSTNNAGELMGAVEALKVALENDVTKVRIWTDSNYVVGGFTHALNWRKNGWLKKDGGVPANIDLWKEYVELYDQLKAKGVDLGINWNEGHSGNFGNEMVDDLAYAGMRHSTNGVFEKKIIESLPEGYWKYETNRHPFLSHRRMYYNTVPGSYREGEYCLGEHDKDDDLAGKRQANGAYAYVLLDEPEKVLEEVRKYSTRLADGNDTVMIARLDYIYRAGVHDMITSYGGLILSKPKDARSILDAQLRDEKELVTKEHNPPLLIHRCVDELSQLREILVDFKAGKPGMTLTDLTPLIYESLIETTKKGEEKTINKIKPEFVVGTSDLDAVVNYRHPDGSLRQTKIQLLLGLDLLDRNALKRIEELEPEVCLVTWPEEPEAFRYATIIKVKGAIGIWAGVYSNMRLVLD